MEVEATHRAGEGGRRRAWLPASPCRLAPYAQPDAHTASTWVSLPWLSAAAATTTSASPGGRPAGRPERSTDGVSWQVQACGACRRRQPQQVAASPTCHPDTHPPSADRWRRLHGQGAPVNDKHDGRLGGVRGVGCAARPGAAAGGAAPLLDQVPHILWAHQDGHQVAVGLQGRVPSVDNTVSRRARQAQRPPWRQLGRAAPPGQPGCACAPPARCPAAAHAHRHPPGAAPRHAPLPAVRRPGCLPGMRRCARPTGRPSRQRPGSAGGRRRRHRLRRKREGGGWSRVWACTLTSGGAHGLCGAVLHGASACEQWSGRPALLHAPTHTPAPRPGSTQRTGAWWCTSCRAGCSWSAGGPSSQAWAAALHLQQRRGCSLLGCRCRHARVSAASGPMHPSPGSPDHAAVQAAGVEGTRSACCACHAVFRRGVGPQRLNQCGHWRSGRPRLPAGSRPTMP